MSEVRCVACEEAGIRIGLRLATLGELAPSVFDEHHALHAAERARGDRLEATLREILYLNGTKLIHRKVSAALKEEP